MARIALVTGANKSLGYETARKLGEAGYRVWLGARDAGRGQASAQALRELGHDVRFVQLAVDDDASVQSAARRVTEDDGKLDVLVNNAGIPGNYAPPLEQGIDDIRHIYDTNVFGPIQVVYAFLPLLKAAGHGNIVNVSSGLGSLTWMSDPENPYYAANLLGYNSSKTALNAVTISLSKALAPFGIRVNSVNPGYVKSDFTNHQGYRSVEEGAAIIVKLATSDDQGPNASFLQDDGALPW